MKATGPPFLKQGWDLKWYSSVHLCRGRKSAATKLFHDQQLCCEHSQPVRVTKVIAISSHTSKGCLYVSSVFAVWTESLGHTVGDPLAIIGFSPQRRRGKQTCVQSTSRSTICTIFMLWVEKQDTSRDFHKCESCRAVLLKDRQQGRDSCTKSSWNHRNSPGLSLSLPLSPLLHL